MIGITRVMVSESRSDKATARTEFRQWSRARKKSAEVEEVEQPMPPKKPRPIIFTQEWPNFTPISGERGVDRTGSAAIITQHYRPPSSSGLGLRILSPATGVRLPLGVLSNHLNTRSSLRVFLFHAFHGSPALICSKLKGNFRPPFSTPGSCDHVVDLRKTSPKFWPVSQKASDRRWSRSARTFLAPDSGSRVPSTNARAGQGQVGHLSVSVRRSEPVRDLRPQTGCSRRNPRAFSPHRLPHTRAADR